MFKMLCWRALTSFRLMFSGKRWAEEFHSNPSLTNARFYRDFNTMAGYYNDHVRWGFMVPAQARRLFDGF